MKKFFILFLMSGILFSQENNIPADLDFLDNQIFDGNEEVGVHYYGGLNALRNFVASEIEYPKLALDNGVEGRVLIKFIVEKDGTISDISIVKDIGYGCGMEVKRILELTSGKWRPAKVAGKPVRSYFRLPIVFTLPPVKRNSKFEIIK